MVECNLTELRILFGDARFTSAPSDANYDVMVLMATMLSLSSLLMSTMTIRMAISESVVMLAMINKVLLWMTSKKLLYNLSTN